MRYYLAMTGLIIILCCPTAQAVNKIYLIESGVDDTIRACRPFSITIAIENDVTWKGMSLGFRIFSSEGATWSWMNMGLACYGAHKYVTIVPGCRMNPLASVWDGGLNIVEQNVSAMTEDSILIGGIANSGGLPPGAEQAMIQLNFESPGRVLDHLYTFCIDSAKVGESGDFVFADEQWGAYPPEIGWTQGGICWPVQACRCGVLSITNMGNPDPVHCGAGSATLTARHMVGYTISWGYELIAGHGTVSLANATGTTNTITYMPAPDEISGTISILVKTGDELFPLEYHCNPNQWATLNFDIHTLGDANNDSAINVGDAVYLINYIFKSGPAPAAWKAGDANCDGLVNVGDAVRLINHVFKGAPSPVNACCQ